MEWVSNKLTPPLLPPLLGVLFLYTKGHPKMGRYESRTYKPLGRPGTGAWDGLHPHKHWVCSKVYKKVGRVGWDVKFLYSGDVSKRRQCEVCKKREDCPSPSISHPQVSESCVILPTMAHPGGALYTANHGGLDE